METFRVSVISLFIRLLARLPLSVIQHVGAFLGLILWHSGSRGAKVACENIRLCYPDLASAQQLQLARSSLIQTGKTITETARAWFAPLPSCLQDFREIEGLELALSYAKAKQGLIFIMPHLGNWEMINLYLGKYFPLTHMYQPNRSEKLDRLIQNLRERSGTTFVATNNAGMRAQLRALKNGDNIGTMPDQEPAQHGGVFSTYFEQTALTSDLVPELCRRTGAKAVVVYALRRPHAAGFKVVFRDVHAELGSADKELALQALNQALESAVHESPEQYLWSYKRFRSRPEGEPELYALHQNHFVRCIQSTFLTAVLKILALLPLRWIQRLGNTVGMLAFLTNAKDKKVSRVNIDLCLSDKSADERQSLTRLSLMEAGKTLLETGLMWRDFRSTHCDSDDLEASKSGTVVLIPPLGNREYLMRHLGELYSCHEYYHPNKSAAVNDLIVRARTRMGIALVPHTTRSIRHLDEALRAGEVVAICPDQQPRLPGGLFIPFFGIAGLTTNVIHTLVTRGHARLVLGYAQRLADAKGFRLRFADIDVDKDLSPEALLSAVNETMQVHILPICRQYRWLDRRFNIRPKGQARLYKF